jgi:hypothetical protein
MTPKGGATLQGGDAGSLAMTAIARSMITGKAQINKAQVKAWIESVKLQLETNTMALGSMMAALRK